MTSGTEITARIEGQVIEPAELIFSVALAEQLPLAEERICCTVADQPVELTQISAAYGTRLHRARVGAGPLLLEYHARTQANAPTAEFDLSQDVIFRRPSRYCESDKLAIIGAKRFAGLQGQELIDTVAEWVHTNLLYVPGSSGPTDGAVDTYLAQQGVCRDFAHLSIAMLRACGLPARLVSVYAPGLQPMDFHAVAEVAFDGCWQIVDATRLAPRAAMLRIATGRDAGDTAFLTIQQGKFQLGNVSVTCYRHEGLPISDNRSVISI